MFRFSIRELMLVTLVVGVCVAWWLDRSHVATESARNREIIMKVRQKGLDVGALLNDPKLSSELNAEWEAEYAAAAKLNPKSPNTSRPSPPSL